jgi:hypothetical protein
MFLYYYMFLYLSVGIYCYQYSLLYSVTRAVSFFVIWDVN